MTLFEVIEILRDNPNITMDENFTGGEVEPTEEPAPGSDVRVWGNVAAFVERLDDELFKSLQVRIAALCQAGLKRKSCSHCVHGSLLHLRSEMRCLANLPLSIQLLRLIFAKIMRPMLMPYLRDSRFQAHPHGPPMAVCYAQLYPLFISIRHGKKCEAL